MQRKLTDERAASAALLFSMDIRIAEDNEKEAIKAFYDAVIDGMADSPFNPRWEKGVYPSDAMIGDAIQNRELYIGKIESRIDSAMINKQRPNDGYRTIRWPTDAENDEAYIIHALGVLPSFSGRGIAKKMTAYAINYARRRGAKAMRLDVLEGNIPAEKAYTALGFRYVNTVMMFYEDTGWTEFKLFELPLRQ